MQAIPRLHLVLKTLLSIVCESRNGQGPTHIMISAAIQISHKHIETPLFGGKDTLNLHIINILQ